MNPNRKIKRNVVIYVIGVFLLATIGGVVTAVVKSDLGGLIFVLSPILMATALRFFGGDGWKDAGLGLKLQGHWGWYLFALLAYPVSMAIVILIGMLLGVTTLNVSWNAFLATFLANLGAQFIPRMLFAMFEEWGWRGYLEPRLVALKVHDLRRHLIVGFVWAFWHFPLIFSTDYTQVPLAIFLPMFVLGVMVSAIVYGQLRKTSGTVWTSVLMHGTANTVVWAIIQSDSLTFNNKMLAYIAPESFLIILLWGALSWWMLSRRKADHAN